MSYYWIELCPDDNSLKILQDFQNLIICGGKKEENLHLTLRFFRDNGNDITKVVNKLSNFKWNKKFDTYSNSLDQFGNCIVALFNNHVLHDYYYYINEFVISSGFEESDFPEYNPHITLYKGENVNINENYDFCLPVMFNKINLMVKGNTTIFSLNL